MIIGGNLQQFISNSSYFLDNDVRRLSCHILYNVSTFRLFEVVEWFIFQLLSAVCHIHATSILHRDIKTMNIFMCRSLGLLKLGDFGISKQLSTEQPLTETVSCHFQISYFFNWFQENLFEG